MRLQGRFLITRRFVSEAGNQYLDLVDLDDGSSVRFSVPLAVAQVPDEAFLVPVAIQAQVSVRRGKTGSYIVVNEIHFSKP